MSKTYLASKEDIEELKDTIESEFAAPNLRNVDILIADFSTDLTVISGYYHESTRTISTQ